MNHPILLFRYRLALGTFIFGLIMSGLTAFPLLHELELTTQWLGIRDGVDPSTLPGFHQWILVVRDGLRDVYATHPWLAYGTDWLAYGHIVIALFFIEPWRNPIPNAWVLKIGLVACAGVWPLALICGPIRGIPFYWRLIDCSFGVGGMLLLLHCLRLTWQMQKGRL